MVPSADSSEVAGGAAEKQREVVCRRVEDCLPWRPQLDKHNQRELSRQSVREIADGDGIRKERGVNEAAELATTPLSIAKRGQRA